MVWIIVLVASALALMFYIICLLVIGSRADAPRSAYLTAHSKEAPYANLSGNSSDNDADSASVSGKPERITETLIRHGKIPTGAVLER
jgi:hypothetical protein